MKRYLLLTVILIPLVAYLSVSSPISAVRADPAIPVELAEVKKGEIYSRITTTGTVKPVLAITVSTQVSGTIRTLSVDVNSSVKKGDLIAQLDQDMFRAEVLQAEAKLEEAKGQLAKEELGVQMQRDQIDAGIAVNQALSKNLAEKFKRAEELYRRELTSKEELESARADWLTSRARLRESSARVDERKVKQADIATMRARVKNAQAELDMAQIRLERSEIRAPIAGLVIQKNVEEGQTVAASFQSPPLVTLADLTKMKVDAWVDEADVGNVKVAQAVDFTVDSFPDRIFKGEVVKIKPSPEIQDNVVVYPTEIHVSNDDLALKPGMTANVTIILAKKSDVLVIPSAAMRVSRQQITSLYPNLDQGGSEGSNQARRRFQGMSPEQRAEFRRKQMLAGRARVWVYRKDQPENVRIRFGALDAQNMEIVEGLKEGDQVIVGIKTSASGTASPSSSRGREISRMFGRGG